MEGAGQWPLLIMMFLAFYLILIVPQTRRAKKEKKFIRSLIYRSVYIKLGNKIPNQATCIFAIET